MLRKPGAAGASTFIPPPLPLEAYGPYGWPPMQPAPPRLRDPRFLFGIGIVLVFVLGGAYLWYSGSGAEAPSTSLLTFPGEPRPDPAGTEPISRISIESSPAGGTVLLDFERVGETPLLHLPVKAGVYVLSIQKEGHARLDTVVWVEAGGSAFRFALPDEAGGTAQRAGSLLHSSTIEPGESYPAPDVEGAIWSAQPQSAGAATRTTQAPPRQASTTVTSSSGGAVLLVAYEPAGGVVYLDHVAQGETPLVLQDVSPGSHTITIRRNGFAPYTTTVEAEASKTLKLSGRLESLSGTLQVLVEPWGSIYIDGKLHRRDTDVRYSTALSTGRHTVRVTHPTYGTWERTVEITGDAPQQLFVNFPGGGRTQPVSQKPAASTPAPADAPARNSAGALSSAAHLRGDDGVYRFAQEAPQLVGGLEGLYRKARYPDAARQHGIEGKVFLQFVVDEEGRVQDARVVRGIGMGCDEEALRLIRSAIFTPGRIGDEAVKVWHALSIEFRLAVP